jgi:hypothetical protein
MNPQLFVTLFVLIAAGVMVMRSLSPRAWAALRIRVPKRKR